MKLDLLTNATVVDDAIGFVSKRSKNLQVISMKIRKNQEAISQSNPFSEPDYDDSQFI